MDAIQTYSLCILKTAEVMAFKTLNSSKAPEKYPNNCRGHKLCDVLLTAWNISI